MSQLTFYTNPMSRGKIIRWMLEETGLAYETKVLDYATTMKSAEFLAINPMGKVPVIKHGSVIVTETPAICAYLAETFPEIGLAPQTSEERAAYYRWLFFAAGPLEQALGLKMLKIEVTAESERSLGCGNPQTTLDVLAQAVSASSYICGERFTAADVYIGSHISFGTRFGMFEERPEFTAYLERVINRPAKLRADELDNALIS
ncbi:MAG: glutathione S-transferase family protein [Burkholderiales bacterium]|nr:glutathione S-transferase family protein [Burkholderiales bacterium]